MLPMPPTRLPTRRARPIGPALVLAAGICAVAAACEEGPPPLPPASASPASEGAEGEYEALEQEDEPLVEEEGDASTYGCEALPPRVGRCGPYRGVGPDASYPAGCTLRVGRSSCTCLGGTMNFWRCDSR